MLNLRTFWFAYNVVSLFPPSTNVTTAALVFSNVRVRVKANVRVRFRFSSKG